MRVADGATVLILEILRIRLDVENVTSGRSRRAGSVRAWNGGQMGQRRVQLCVLIQSRPRLRARIRESRLEYQSLVGSLGIQPAVVATVTAQQRDILALSVLLDK